MSSLQLCGYLLSANEAVLQLDDFNQLASALPRAKARQLLEQRWRVKSAIDCRRLIEKRLGRLGKPLPEEAEAFAAWANGEPIDSEEFDTLQEVCDRLHECALVASVRQVRSSHLSTAAWDIQQVAYIVRLGHSVGYLSRGIAETILSRLHAAARGGYRSWKNFSLSTLVTAGLRGQVDASDREAWQQLADSHKLFLATVEAAAVRVSAGSALVAPGRETHLFPMQK
ncbi:MAG: DUF1266 domain-containing protein [Gammaproteobacteria bacterium]|nr:DUF1266 domain-containing protein [Gammaproteobacteria bacterium]MBU2289080.1 DUF1266 domain-containing protein [Gammaproteobacteria bacterium]